MSNQERDSYNPSAVEEKWQRNWEERGTNSLTLEQFKSAKDPYYQLMMFPYPSAAVSYTHLTLPTILLV